jgi:hypothetical protein
MRLFLVRIYPHYSDNNYYYGVNNAGTSVTAPTPGHFYGGSRTAATGTTTVTAYVDTTGTSSSTVTGGIPAVLYLLADDTTGANPFQGIETFAAVALGLTGTQEGQLQAAYAAYVASVP